MLKLLLKFEFACLLFCWLGFDMIRTLYGKVSYGRIDNFSTWVGKTVVISGASSGIGEELCLQYAKLGANIVLSARREEKLHKVSAACISNGAKATAVIRCDVSKKDDCEALITKSIDSFGKIDVLILNAGVGQVSDSLFTCVIFVTMGI